MQGNLEQKKSKSEKLGSNKLPFLRDTEQRLTFPPVSLFCHFESVYAANAILFDLLTSTAKHRSTPAEYFFVSGSVRPKLDRAGTFSTAVKSPTKQFREACNGHETRFKRAEFSKPRVPGKLFPGSLS